MLLRVAGRADAVRLVGFQRRALSHLPHLGAAPEDVELDLEAMADYLSACRRDPDHLVLIAATPAGEVVGSLGFHAAPGAPYRHKAELGMAVDEGFWGVGLGRVMMRAVLGEVRARGRCHKLNLRVRATNERALRLYASLGFVVEGRERDAARVGDRYEDELLLGMVFEGAPRAGGPRG